MRKLYLLTFIGVLISISVFAKGRDVDYRILAELDVEDSTFFTVLDSILESVINDERYERMNFPFYAEQGSCDTVLFYFISSDIILSKELPMEGFIFYKKHYFFCRNQIIGLLKKTNKRKKFFYYNGKDVLLDDSFPSWIYKYIHGKFFLVKKYGSH